MISLCTKKKDKLSLLTCFEAKTTNFIPIWKVSWNNPTLSEDLSMIYDHIFAYSHPVLNNIVLFVVAHVAH